MWGRLMCWLGRHDWKNSTMYGSNPARRRKYKLCVRAHCGVTRQVK